ncbi:MAG: MOSC domain-containing protein [Bacteroidetes bacterium]|nr:MAG: MOSC domain-containing protein [Bacteroidota bacterium]
MLTLTHIYVYPVKSLGGMEVPEARVEERGLQYDRNWMLVNEKGKFLTQRQLPQMALLRAEIRQGYLYIHQQQGNMPALQLPLQSEYGPGTEVQVWNDRCQAQFVGPQADQWLSQALGRACRLVYMPGQSHRQVDPQYAPPGQSVSFADGYPFLIIGQAALHALNQRLQQPVGMNRFRPNLVFSGGQPHEEDQWHRFRIGSLSFRAVKACARCAIPNIDPHTGIAGTEPTQTLKTYRRKNGKIYFGQNLLAENTGTLRRGQPIELLQAQA